MSDYMGYADLRKSDRVGIDGAARLAREHGYDYEILDTHFFHKYLSNFHKLQKVFLHRILF